MKKFVKIPCKDCKPNTCCGFIRSPNKSENDELSTVALDAQYQYLKALLDHMDKMGKPSLYWPKL